MRKLVLLAFAGIFLIFSGCRDKHEKDGVTFVSAREIFYGYPFNVNIVTTRIVGTDGYGFTYYTGQVEVWYPPTVQVTYVEEIPLQYTGWPYYGYTYAYRIWAITPQGERTYYLNLQSLPDYPYARVFTEGGVSVVFVQSIY